MGIYSPEGDYASSRMTTASSVNMVSQLGGAVESVRQGVASPSAADGSPHGCGSGTGRLADSSSGNSAASSGGASAVTRIICTNHYQSDRFRDDPVNVENIRVSDSGYRYKRVQQLLDSLGSIDYLKAAAVLRDIRGVDGEDVGYCNDLSINQMLAMHSVIFKPAEKKIWVSTSPWQFGKFVCFDLDEVFGEEGLSTRGVSGDGLSDSAAHFTGVPGQATHSGSRNLSSGEESAHFASVDVDQRTCEAGSASHLDSRSLSSGEESAHFARVDVDQRTCGAGSASHSDSRNLSSCDDCAHFASVDVDQRTCGAGSARHLGCTLVGDSGFSDDEMSIPADKFLETEAFRNVLKFKAMQQTLATASKSRREVPADSLALFVSWNPSYYGTYVSVASYLESLGKNAEADEYYRRALTCPMKLSERQHLETQLRGR